MNSLITVLCAGAICSAVQARDVWVGVFMILATLLAMWQNYHDWAAVRRRKP